MSLIGGRSPLTGSEAGAGFTTAAGFSSVDEGINETKFFRVLISIVSFSQAEPGENSGDNIFAHRFTGDFAERGERSMHVHGDEFKG